MIISSKFMVPLELAIGIGGLFIFSLDGGRYSWRGEIPGEVYVGYGSTTYMPEYSNSIYNIDI